MHGSTISTKSNSPKITGIGRPHFEAKHLDKTTGDVCPRCGLQTLTIYYEDEADLQLGARCEECGLKGFFMNGKLVQIVNA